MNLPWQPIEGAPKDRAVMLFYPDCYGIQLVAIGSWDPYESYWFFQNYSVLESDKKNMMPTHYCEIDYPDDRF